MVDFRHCGWRCPVCFHGSCRLADAHAGLHICGKCGAVTDKQHRFMAVSEVEA